MKKLYVIKRDNKYWYRCDRWTRDINSAEIFSSNYKYLLEEGEEYVEVVIKEK